MIFIITFSPFLFFFLFRLADDDILSLAGLSDVTREHIEQYNMEYYNIAILALSHNTLS